MAPANCALGSRRSALGRGGGLLRGLAGWRRAADEVRLRQVARLERLSAYDDAVLLEDAGQDDVEPLLTPRRRAVGPVDLLLAERLDPGALPRHRLDVVPLRAPEGHRDRAVGVRRLDQDAGR